MDTVSKQVRSRNMSRIRSKNTTPELVVRRLIHGLGYWYRLHAPDLPGRPDLVFRRARKAIFVHGCFWHRHRCPNGLATPKTRPQFWRGKFQINMARDIAARRALRRDGWRVLVVWECETRAKDRTVLTRKLVRFLES